MMRVREGKSKGKGIMSGDGWAGSEWVMVMVVVVVVG